MVLAGQVSSAINDHPPVVCGAEVVGPDETGAPGGRPAAREERWRWLVTVAHVAQNRKR
jgi:hypothetical protein